MDIEFNLPPLPEPHDEHFSPATTYSLPQQTKYNDWAEVIDACSRAAYYQAIIEK